MKRHPLLPLPAALPNLHALLVPVVAHAFETLRVAAALRDDVQWYAVHAPAQPLLAMELEHQREHDRAE
jgi:hypothetical protein